MSQSGFFRQCELVSGTTMTVGWIKEESAKVGAKIQILENPGMDETMLWTVKAVGSARIPDKEAKSLERQFARHRKATDI